MGATTQDRRETVQGLRGAFLIGAPVAILLASALGYLLAGRALAPVEAMRRRAAGITLEQSGERLPLPAADDEIRHLGETLNAMLDRIEESLAEHRALMQAIEARDAAGASALMLTHFRSGLAAAA